MICPLKTMHPPLPPEEQKKLDEAIKNARCELATMLINTPEKKKRVHILEKLDYLREHPNG